MTKSLINSDCKAILFAVLFLSPALKLFIKNVLKILFFKNAEGIMDEIRR